MSAEQPSSRLQSFYRRWQVFRDSAHKDADFILKIASVIGVIAISITWIIARL